MYEFDDRLETLLAHEDQEVRCEQPEILSQIRTSPDWEEVRMCAKCVGECKIF